MSFIVTHDAWGTLVRTEYPAVWMPWSAPDARERARRFRWRVDAVRAVSSWPVAIRVRFRIVEVPL